MERLYAHFVIKSLRLDKYNEGLEKSFKLLYNIKMEEENKELSVEELKKKLEDCQKLKEEYLAGWQRARADLLNYKKGELERVGELIKYADVGIILKILPILDNFEIAARQTPAPSEERVGLSGQEKEKIDKVVQGFLQIKNQFQDFLREQGVAEIKSVGERFDPNLHEVVEEVEVNDKEHGIIIEEIQKGYKIQDRLLRPAKVRVSK